MNKIVPGTEANFKASMEGRTTKASVPQTKSRRMITSSYGSTNLFDVTKRRRNKLIRTGAVTVQTQEPVWYVPEFQTTDWFLPRSMQEIYQWARYFYRIDPIVGAAIDIHASFPISRFEIDCPDPTVKKFFENVCEELELYKTLLDIGLEYYKLGDVFPYLLWDASKGYWKKVIIFPPENISIKPTPLTGDVKYTLKTTPEIKKLWMERNKNPENKKVWESLSKGVQKSIQEGKDIELDSRCISHLAHRMSPYDTRGTPLIARLFKVLMFEDRLIEAQYAIADRHITPLTVVQVGTAEMPAPPEELENVREQIDLASDDPDYSIITSWGLDVKKIGATGSVLDLSREREYIEKQKLAGLGISKALLHGEGPTYATSAVAYEALIQRYESYRQTLANWIMQVIFHPIAVAQEFKDKEGEWLIPAITWQRLRLRDETQRLSYILQAVDKNLVSVRSFLNVINLDYASEEQYLKEEKDSIFKEKGEGRRYERDDKDVLGKIQSDEYLKSLFSSEWTRGAKFIALTLEEELVEVHNHFLDRIVTGVKLDTSEVLCSAEVDNTLYNYLGLVTKEGARFAGLNLTEDIVDTSSLTDKLKLRVRDKLSILRDSINIVRLFTITGEETVETYLKTKGEGNLINAKERLNKEVKVVVREAVREAFTQGIIEMYKQFNIDNVRSNGRVFSITEALETGRENVCVFYPEVKA